MRIIYILILLITISDYLYSNEKYFPPVTGNNWELINPDELGYCHDKIDSLYKYLEENDSKAFILLKDGKIVLEKYFGTFTQDSIWYWASAGKTLTGFLVGIAQAEGKLNIHDKTSKYLGVGWTSCTKEEEDQITVLNQITMTTGLDDAVDKPDCTNPECLKFKKEAGKRWAYHNAPYTLLDKVIESATGSNLNVYVTTKLKSQIGMNGLYVKTGDNNVYFSNARSMARYGLLLLNRGVWDNKIILKDSNYFNNMTNSSQQLNPSYGYLTWLNGKSSFMLPQSQIVFQGSLNPNAPSDLFAAMGKNAQMINVVPSQNLVWIRMGNEPVAGNGAVTPNFNNKIWEKINSLVCNTSVDDEQSQVISINGNEIILRDLESHLDIYDLLGNLIYRNDSKHGINSLNLDNGIYFLINQKADGSIKMDKIIIN